MIELEAKKVVKAEKTLTCKHCGNEDFLVHDVKLTSAWMSLFEDDWLSEFAELNVCTACGYLHWFTKVPSMKAQASKPIECPECGKTIKSSRSFCPHCDHDFSQQEEDKSDSE